MRKGLFSKMVLTYTIIIAISFIIIATFLSFWFRGYYFDQKKKQLAEAANVIKPYVISREENTMSSAEFTSILSFYSKLNNVNTVIVDSLGYVFEVSNDKFSELVAHQQVSGKDLQKLKLNRIVEKSGMFGEVISGSGYTFEIPIITANGSFNGAIIMSTPATDLTNSLSEAYAIIWISAVVAIVLSCIITYYFSQKIIIKPLEQINSVAGKISKGEVGKRVSINSNDEIGELAKSFNSMADSLEEVEKNRREFISNVSHELRSPITSIKGFISGILDGVIPKEKENYYLSIAYEEIQRLTRLINDLLDLTAIESGKFKLKIGRIDVNEIIRLTVIKSETRIKDKKLNVEVCFSEDMQFAAGDRDRIIQVLTNLLDNAIKYVNEGGNIIITSKAKGEKVFVSIFNDGPNISNEDEKHIWERFYKSDKSRTTKISTGLGLPIVRNILTQHGEDIKVDNKEDGVTFTFTLKRL